MTQIRSAEASAIPPKSATAPLAVVLAAGEGTRMRSRIPKVLHPVAGLPMLGHVLAAVRAAGASGIAVVIGPGRDDVRDFVRSVAPNAVVHVQLERLGTAHAVLSARESIEAYAGRPVLTLFGDTPLVTPETIRALAETVVGGTAVAALGFEARDPRGYGRLVIGRSGLDAIVEHKDASEAQRRITFCNAGLMALGGGAALSLLDSIGSDNAQREFYLTDAVAIARKRRLPVAAVAAPEDEVMGVNDRVQLASAEALMQRRLREKAMSAGATLIDPTSVTFCYDTCLGRDVTVEPHVVFGPGVTVDDDVLIRGFSHIEGAQIASGAQIGPFARIRPGTAVGRNARIGNFVETKAATIADGAKVNHLSYIGDAEVGTKANIGAGTITCNYDGFRKSRTVIGAGAFIGSNSALVAPVTVGDGAMVAAGSVITRDVAADDLAVARGELQVKAGWAGRFRKLNQKKKTPHR